MISFLYSEAVPEEVFFSPLSNERINQLTSIAEQLTVEPNGMFLIRSAREAFEVLRFHASVMSDCVRGYEQFKNETAVTLLTRCIWDTSIFEPCPYLVMKTFEAFCYHGYTSGIVKMAIRYKDVLLKPFRFPLRFCKTMEEASCYSCGVPSRLAYGLSLSIRKTGIDVLAAFFFNADARQIVDNLLFVSDLFAFPLNLNDMRSVVDLFLKENSPYASTLFTLSETKAEKENWFYDSEQKPDKTDCFFDEQQLIEYELQDWCRFYDDRGVILNAIPFVRQAELPRLLRIYHNDPLVVAAVVERLRNC